MKRIYVHNNDFVGQKVEKHIIIMTKRLQEYAQYTRSELSSYTKSEAACIKKINTTLHLNIGPYVLGDFKNSIRNLLVKKKIGFFDTKMNGIILEIRDIKLLGNLGSIRFDDPKIHLDIQADCFVFQPHVGAIVRGNVRHISPGQIGVILYRVFSVSIRLAEQSRPDVEINSEVEFSIKKFNFQNVFPYIEGELIQSGNVNQENALLQEYPCEGLQAKDNSMLKLLSEIKEENAIDAKKATKIRKSTKKRKH